FYERACRILEIPDLRRPSSHAEGARRRRLAGAVLEDKVFYWTRDALNFGAYHRRNAARASNVETLINANVSGLVQEADGLIGRLAVATTGGRRFSIRPSVVVLACGGIENARLMLASRARSAEGVGNASGVVGRYYMDHPRGPAGTVEATPALSALWPAYWSGKRLGPGRFRIGVGLTADARNDRRVLNSYVNLNPVYAGVAVEAIRNLYRKRGKALKDRSLVRALLTGVPDVGRYLAFKRFGRGRVELLAIENFTEQEPRATNAVTLSDRLDAFGNPLARVRWSLSELDRRSVRVLHEALDAELRAKGMGRVRPPIVSEDDDPWRVSNDAAHHIGTTRMGTDPKSSVVDPECRVHGIENLYIAGSSVFPTGGAANPTLTIMALAARIADRVRRSSESAIAVRSGRGSVAVSQETV
ncbi:MAG: GMC oxidoreductase, partial [Actinomycetota bacterium]